MFDLIVVGGGIGGSAAALRAAQHGLRFAWVRGDEGTARASRARYVYNVDNMIGVHDAIVRKKAIALLAAPEDAHARALLEATHFHSEPRTPRSMRGRCRPSIGGAGPRGAGPSWPETLSVDRRRAASASRAERRARRARGTD